MKYKILHLSLLLSFLPVYLHAADGPTQKMTKTAVKNAKKAAKKAAREAAREATIKTKFVFMDDTPLTDAPLTEEEALAEIEKRNTSAEKPANQKHPYLRRKKECFWQKNITNEELKNRIEHIKPKISVEELKKRDSELVQERQNLDAKEKIRNEEQLLKYAIYSLGVKDKTDAALAAALTRYYSALFPEQETIPVEPTEALQVFTNFISNPKCILYELSNLPGQPEKDSDRKEYQTKLTELRKASQSLKDLPLIREKRKTLIELIRNEQKNHGMPLKTWGDTISSWIKPS